MYDLGDQFMFKITLESFPTEKVIFIISYFIYDSHCFKTGKVELLGGEMDGPPEDSNGFPECIFYFFFGNTSHDAFL